jgi:adhesin transport system outer membrane protein
MNSRQTVNTLLAFGVTALLSATVGAQQQNTLKDAAQKAVLSNPEVLQRWHAYQAAINEKDVAFGGYLPRLDLAAGTGREHRDDPILKSNYSTHSTTLTLTQMLYDGFATRNEVKRLDSARQVRLFELFDASETAALEASKAYLDVLRYRKLVGFAEENYVRHRALFEQIQKKAQAGVGRRVDLEQASGRLALAEANLLTETANLHDVSARYQRLVGDVPGKDLAAPPPLGTGLPADAGVVLKAAQERNPAIQAAVENVRSAMASVDVRKAAYQPRVDLRLREERGSDLNGYIGSTNNRTAEVVLSWNLFNGLSDLARSRQYADQVSVAKDLRDKACRDVRQTVAIAYDDVRKLTEELTYLDQHQLSTEKARDAYRKQFDIGQRSLLDLLDTENELFQARRAYANGEYDLAIAQARSQAGFGNLMGTLGLSRVNQDTLPDVAGWEAGSEQPEYCPPEAPVLYAADKAALNARAVQLMKESAPAAEASSGAAGGEREVADALKAWMLAWSSRNLHGYLDSYAQNFAPAEGGDRAAWAGSRKRIISKAGDIHLDISDIKLAMKDPQHAVTTFRQTYRAASYQDVVLKTLEWQKIDGKWLIIHEVAEALPGR